MFQRKKFTTTDGKKLNIKNCCVYYVECEYEKFIAKWNIHRTNYLPEKYLITFVNFVNNAINKLYIIMFPYMSFFLLFVKNAEANRIQTYMCTFLQMQFSLASMDRENMYAI